MWGCVLRCQLCSKSDQLFLPSKRHLLYLIVCVLRRQGMLMLYLALCAYRCQRSGRLAISSSTPKAERLSQEHCLKETKRMKQCFERQNVIENVQKQNIWRECIFKAIVQQSSEVKTVGSTYSDWTNRIQTWFIHATLLRSYWRTYRPAKSPTRTSSQQTQNLNWNRMVLLCWRCTAMAKFLTMATISGMKRPREASPLMRTTLSWAVLETNEKMDLINNSIKYLMVTR